MKIISIISENSHIQLLSTVQQMEIKGGTGDIRKPRPGSGTSITINSSKI